MEKEIDAIYQEMLELFAQRSGYLPSISCDLAARLYAAAAQLQSLYIQAQWVLDQSFPQTAQGEALEKHAQLRGLRRGVATRAAGSLRFGVSAAVGSDLAIDAGTVCMTADGVRFQTTEDAVLSKGLVYVDVPAEAVEPGKAGNAAANTVTIMAAMPVGVRACTNPEAFSGGDDEEGDEALRLRLLDSYRRLPNGANAAYYEQTALSCDGVAAAVAVGRARGVGTVDLYIATDAGVPDEDMLRQVDEALQERREISVDLRVLAPKAEPVEIAVALRPAQGRTFAQARTDADAVLRAAFTGAILGKGVTLAYLGNLLYRLESVENYRFTSPAEDIAASPTILPVLGGVAITELEG